jgi:hypothetical protein
MSTDTKEEKHRSFLKSLTLHDLIKDKTRDVVTIDKDATVEDALQLLSDENILSVPILQKTQGRVGPHHTYYIKGTKIVGVLSISDLCVAIAFQQCFAEFKDTPAKLSEVNKESFQKLLKTSIFNAKVSDFLGLTEESKHLWEYQDTEKLDTILEIFTKGVHRVLVHTKDGKLRNLSQSDVVAFLKKQSHLLGDVVNQDVAKLGLVDEKTKIQSVSMYEPAIVGFQRMWNQGWDIPALPVVDKTGDVVATLSASDLRGLTKPTFSSLLLPVLDFLQQQRGGARSTIYTQPSAPLVDVIHKVAWGHVHRIWVIKSHKLVGVISLSDIICKFSPFDFKKPES